MAGLCETDSDLPGNIAFYMAISPAEFGVVGEQLSQQGLLVTEPNKGVRVAEQPSMSVRPLVAERRRTIETFALDSMFDQITEDDIAVWDAILADIKIACQQGNKVALVDYDLDFHRSIVQCQTW